MGNARDAGPQESEAVAVEAAAAGAVLRAPEQAAAGLLSGGRLLPAQALALQRSIGNSATRRALARRPGGASSAGGVAKAESPAHEISARHLDEVFCAPFASGRLPAPDVEKAFDGTPPGFALDLVLDYRRGAAEELRARLEQARAERAQAGEEESARADALDERVRTLSWMVPYFGKVITAALRRLALDERTTVIWLCSHTVGGSATERDASLLVEALETAPLDQAGGLADYLLDGERAQLNRIQRVLGGDQLEAFYMAIAPLLVNARVSAGTFPDPDAVPVLPWSGRPGFRGTHYSYDARYSGDRTQIVIKWWMVGPGGVPTPFGRTERVAPDDIVAIHFERDDPDSKAKAGEYRYVPAVSFLAWHDRRFWQNVELGAQAAFVVGGAFSVAGAVGWVARAVAVLEVSLNAAGVIVNEFRTEIDKTEEGQRFLKRWDLVQRLVMYYGMARLVTALPKVLRSMTSLYRGVRPQINVVQRAGDFERRMGEVDRALNEAEREAQAARAAGAPATEPAAPGAPPPEGAPPSSKPAAPAAEGAPPSSEPAAPAAEGAPPASEPAPAPVVEEPPPSSSAAAGEAADPRIVRARTRLDDAVAAADATAQRAKAAAERSKAAQEALDRAREELRQAREQAAQAQAAGAEADKAYERARQSGAPRNEPRKAATAARDAAAAAQRRVAAAQRSADRAAEELAEAERLRAWRDKLAGEATEEVGKARGALEKAEQAVAEGEIPRLGPDEPFSPDKRRPEFKGKGPMAPTARGRPGAIAEGAQVRIFTDPLKSAAHQQRLQQIVALSKSNATQAGNQFAQLIGEEQGWGKVAERFRAQHGRIGRRWDFGDAKEITIEGRTGSMSSDKLDQLWFDLNERGRIDLTVPSLSPQAEAQLSRLGGEWRRWTGRTPTILVREVAP